MTALARVDLNGFILDACTLATICRLRLPHHVPPGFHGTWAPELASS
jgi:carotenoid cleavage dioxygenase-like enzyme